MSKQPVCSGADAVKVFRKIGYEVDHQTGSHIILRHASGRRLTSQTIGNSPRERYGQSSGKRVSQRTNSVRCCEVPG